MSKHSKCGIRVVSSTGEAWTTKRGARRLVSRELGARQPDGTIQMYEYDYRVASEPVSNIGPCHLLEMVRQFPVDLHYQDDRAVLKFWPEMANQGIAA
jgi:hypothetical protein